MPRLFLVTPHYILSSEDIIIHWTLQFLFSPQFSSLNAVIWMLFIYGTSISCALSAYQKLQKQCQVYSLNEIEIS
jgi:CHASE1-domain containing sensor protein